MPCFEKGHWDIYIYLTSLRGLWQRTNDPWMGLFLGVISSNPHNEAVLQKQNSVSRILFGGKIGSLHRYSIMWALSSWEA